jgi:hypothetical protein
MSHNTDLIFIVIVQVYTRLLARLPFRWDCGVDVGLMYDLGYQLRSIVDEIRSWRRNLWAVDGICSAVFEEKGYERAEGIQEGAYDYEVYYEEDDGSASHCEG